MTPTEDRVRELLHAAAPPSTGVPIEAVAGRVRRRRLAAAAATAVTVCVVAAGAAALVIAGRPGTNATVTPPAVRATALPAGMQPVSYHGVQVLVPAAWKIDDLRCASPLHDTVVIEDGSQGGELCLAPTPRGLTVVRITAINSPMGRLRAQVATDPVRVDGRSARRGTGVPGGEKLPVSVLVLPDPGVVVSVESPDASAAGRLLDTVTIAPVDANGCSARVMSLDVTAPARPKDFETALVPGNPSAVTVCRYSDNWLARSSRLAPAQTTQLVDQLNALPAGVSHPGPGFAEAADQCAADARRGFIVHASYPDKPTLNIDIHISGCDKLSASNGIRTTKIDQQLTLFLVSILGYDGSTPVSLR